MSRTKLNGSAELLAHAFEQIHEELLDAHKESLNAIVADANRKNQKAMDDIIKKAIEDIDRHGKERDKKITAMIQSYNLPAIAKKINKLRAGR